MKTTVSVITPLYNGAAHIEECMESVIAQGRTDIEHIIIDNSSDDNGPLLVTYYMQRYPHIRLLHNEIPGSSATRNKGIAEARGRYIAFLDCDDTWAPEKLDRQILAMNRAGAAFSWGNYSVVGPSGALIREQHSPKTMTVKQHLMKRGVIGCLTAIYDTEMLGRHFMTDLPIREDFCLWLDILKQCERDNLPTIGVQENLAFYRVHDSGKSSKKTSAAKGQWRALRLYAKLSLSVASFYFASYAINAILDRVWRHAGRI